MKSNTPYSLAFFLFLLCVCACTQNPVTGKKEFVLMTEEQEIALGKETDPQISAEYGLYEDKSLQGFIMEKGNEMAAISHRPKLEYQFRIVDSEILNAFAVPGGYVYFTRGIMAHFNNEAEFAGVLGHEIGHVAARHSAKQQTNQALAQLGVLAGSLISEDFGRFASKASQGLQLLFMKFGRDDERESDELGVEYSSKIGYDAREMAGFFNTIKRQTASVKGQELPEFLSTHPDPGERNETVANLAGEWKEKLNLSESRVNRDAYMRRIEGLVYGEDPRQGFRENNVFYHPVLRFRFATPRGWAYQNSAQRVQMATKDGKAMLLFTLAKGNNQEDAADRMLEQYGLQEVEARRKVTINGLEAVEVIAEQLQQEGQEQQASTLTLSYLIRKEDAIYHILGASAAAEFEEFKPQFLETMRSFAELRDPEKIGREPERIRIKTVAATGTLRQVLSSFSVTDKRMEELAILNGMELNDQVKAGMLIKVPGR